MTTSTRWNSCSDLAPTRFASPSIFNVPITFVFIVCQVSNAYKSDNHSMPNISGIHSKLEFIGGKKDLSREMETKKEEEKRGWREATWNTNLRVSCDFYSWVLVQIYTPSQDCICRRLERQGKQDDIFDQPLLAMAQWHLPENKLGTLIIGTPTGEN